MEATRTDTKKNEIKYEKSELELMTTYQLREICRREKIMNGVIHPLDKEELIQAIMRYMGKRQDFFICDKKKGGEERVEEFLKKTRIDKALQRIILPVPDFSLRGTFHRVL